MAKLYFQGHGSFRITADNGKVIYVDPYAGDGYEPPADLILVSHQHGDHNKAELCAQNPGCVVITEKEALSGGKHNTIDVPGGIRIKAVPAENKNHNPADCVGYIIDVDGLKLYAAGDTSTTAAMGGFAAMGLDYALLPCDGVYNMDLDEAAECARVIGARVNIPIHMKPGALFCMERAEAYSAPDKLIVPAGTEIEL
ncbi:MAG: MBL fold metallo-hydrolase [Defluviitaleaceae bacterium]|nr:MBL fold metallo-hydrolase [Defluviitaleaceae bacterium]MCL2835889.1 MBL fold metallo-hydrolase [Defluviitaleaceae bacterium]